MRAILFYITGHGFGHATRTIEVINQLVARGRDILPIISTSVPAWLFEQQVATDFQYIRCQNSVGAVQKDWRSVDKLETLKRCSQFLEVEAEFISEQLELVKQKKVAAIVSDIPAAPFVVAKRASLPSFGLANFSWDWIYAPYAAQYPQYSSMVEHIRQCYSMASCLLRLPFHGDLSAFPVIEDIPLVATRSSMERQEVADKLGIDPKKKIILLYLGKFDYSRVLSEKMLKRDDYCFMPPDRYKDCKLPFQDLLKAAEVVLTKPGYGMVSECIANQTAIMYTAREDFGEYYPLVEGIKKYTHNHFVGQEELFSGQWAEYLDGLFAAEYHWPDIAINGAEIAAEMILKSI